MLAQVQHLAAVYGRVLPKLSAPALEEAVLSSAQRVLAGNIDSAFAETDLHHRLAQVEGQLLALQQQLISLTKGLLQRRELPGDPRSHRQEDPLMGKQPASRGARRGNPSFLHSFGGVLTRLRAMTILLWEAELSTLN